jgi:drug/metabolite transporter (DMT)-like permease
MRASFGFGVVCAVLGAALWGFSGACAQFLFAHYEISALFITVVRMLGAGVLFGIVLLATWRHELARLLADRASLARLLVFGGFGLFLDQFAYIMAIDFTNAGTATVLQGLNMVFVVVATCSIVRRRPHARELAGVVCALAATVLIATGGDLGSLNMPVPGLVWGIVNAAAVAFYVMYPQRLFKQWGSVAVTGLGMLLGGLVALVVFLAQGATAALTGVPAGQALFIPTLDAPGVLALLGIVVVGTFGAFGLYLHGVSVVGSVRGSLIGAVEPVSAMLCSCLWLATPFGGADWAGLVLMIATIVLVSVRPKTPGARP